MTYRNYRRQYRQPWDYPLDFLPPPSVFNREVRSYQDYLEFKAFLVPLVIQYPFYLFEILKIICEGSGWGQLGFQIIPRWFDSRVTAILFLEEPYRHLWGGDGPYYPSAREAINRAAWGFFQNVIFNGFVFMNNQHEYRIPR